jgi:hypothetical protein
VEALEGLDGILSPQAKNSVDQMGSFYHTKLKTLLKGCHTTTEERPSKTLLKRGKL